MTDPTVSIDSIARQSGIAGQYAYRVQVTYHHSDGSSESSVATFVSSDYRAPVVLLCGGVQTFVEDCWRYGSKLDAQWIRAFYGQNAD
jgi:hypothetical protein